MNVIYIDASNISNTSIPHISAFGISLTEFSNIGFPLAILIIVEIALIYFLTYEFFIKEQLVSYGNLAFTIAWALLPHYINNIGALSSFSVVLISLYFGFLVITIILMVYPIVTYFNKRKDFKIIKDKYSRLREDYENISKTYKEINDKINNEINPAIENSLKTCKRVNDLHEIALRSPETIIKNLNDKPEIPPIHIANVRYTIIGLGGAGVEIVKEIIRYFDLLGVFDQPDNAVQFVLYDTNDKFIADAEDSYKNTKLENIVKIPVRFSNVSEGNILTVAPWLTGEPASITGGTGMRRGLGAAAYMANKDRLVNRIKEYVDEITNRFPNKKGNAIIIINSLGGGTGSGTFIKLAMDLRNALPKGSSTVIYGFGILPKAAEGQTFHANAYAALKELMFLFEHGQRQLGAQENLLQNPFDGYFLLSLEGPSQAQKENISSAISKFLLDLGTSEGFDPADIKMAVQSFGSALGKTSFLTFDFHEIIFPASRVSWYKNVGKPTAEKLRSDFKNIKEEAEKIFEESKKAVAEEEALINNIKEFIDTDIKNLDREGVYKKWREEIKSIKQDLNKIHDDVSIGGKFYITPLKDKINSILNDKNSEKTIPNLDTEIKSLEAIVSNEYQQLKNPLNTQVSKVFPVDPDRFQVERLFSEGIVLVDLMSGDREVELREAFARLTQRIGEVGQTMANIDYQRIKQPIHTKTQDEVRFISKYAPELSPVGRGYAETPGIGGALIEVTSHKENLSHLPLDDELIGSVRGLTYADPLLKKGVSPNKRFSISTYWILIGLYLWKPRSDMSPVLRDLPTLVEGYQKEYEALKRRFFVHHTLFYDNPELFRSIVHVTLPNNIIQARDMITEFWVKYNPFLSDAKYWGILDLAKIYSDTIEMSNLLSESFDQILNYVDTVKKGVVKDLGGLANIKRNLSMKVSDLLADMQTLPIIREAGSEKPEIEDAITEVVVHVEELKKKLTSYLENYSDIQKSLQSIIDEASKKADSSLTFNPYVKRFMEYFKGIVDELQKFNEEINKVLYE